MENTVTVYISSKPKNKTKQQTYKLLKVLGAARVHAGAVRQLALRSQMVYGP